MAHLSDNGLYTIEYGSSAWRSILNDNISKTITETKLNNGITTNINLTGDIIQTGNYNLTGDINQTGDYNLNGNLNLSGNLVVGGTTLTTRLVTAEDDIKFTDENKGVVLKDRSDGHFYRIYVDNGACDVEQITTSTSTLDVVDIFGDGSGIALYQLDGNANDTGGQYNASSDSDHPIDTCTYDGTLKFGNCFKVGSSNDSDQVLDTDIDKTAIKAFSFWCNITNINGDDFGILSFDFQRQNKDVPSITTTNGDVLLDNAFTQNETLFIVVQLKDSSVEVYQNGDLLVSKSVDSGTGFDDNRLIALDSNADYHDSLIDQVRVFNRALTASEVSDLYNES